jgi:GxxExxY protein
VQKSELLSQRRKGAKAEERERVEEEEVGKLVVDLAVQIHRDVGPGLLETVYEVILLHELLKKGLRVQRQVAVPVTYRELKFEEGFRVDLVVEDKVIIELKCVEKLSNAHKKQLLTYLRLTDKSLGYWLNFGAALMKEGITRIINRASSRSD